MSSTSTRPVVQANASGDGHQGSKRGSAAIEADMRAARERLAGTIDEIVDRAHPKAFADRGTARLKGLVVDEAGQPRIDRIATAVGGAVGAVTVLLVLRKLAQRKK